jgi:hypothetical protein
VIFAPAFSSAAIRKIALSVKRAAARVDSNVNWEADWNELPETKKRKKREGRQDREETQASARSENQKREWL